MNLLILHNHDHDVLADDPGRMARQDVLGVAQALEKALVSSGLNATCVAAAEQLDELQFELDRQKPDLVFNLCESHGADSRGEIAVAQLLESLDVPFTGSDSSALHLALHKAEAKRTLRENGVLTPDFWQVESVEELDFLDLSWPLIVKPAREDASVGIDFDSVVRNLNEAKLAVSRILNRLFQPAILEQFIEGREIYVSLLGNQPCRALPLSEIQFGAAFSNKPKIVSYNAKWETDSPECVDSPSVSCVLDDALKTVLVDAAKRAFNALGARDYGRVDFRLSSEGQPFVIDINPNCDLHPDAGFSKAAKSAGMSYEDLALFLVQIALERHHAHSPPDTSRQRHTGQPSFTNRDVHSGGSAMRAGARRPRTHAKSS